MRRFIIGIFLGVILLFICIFGQKNLQNAFLQYSKILSPIASPLTFDQTLLQRVKPKLSSVKNSFVLKRKATPLIPQANASDYSNEASSYILVDLDSGQVIEEKNAGQQLPIASLTKIMTAVVALDLTKQDDVFTITPQASSVVPTKIGIVPGQNMSVRELLYAMLMTSANDAAEAIRDGVNQEYQQQIFINAMNEKAHFLKLSNTSFSNPQGFDSNSNYSSANDLAVLASYALTNYSLIREIARKDYAFISESSLHKQFDLYNWNGLLDVYPNTIGLKIGNTDDAKMTTIVASERGGKKLLAVVLGAPDIFSRDQWAADLLDDGYQQTLGLPAIHVTRQQLQAKYNTWHYF